MNINLPKFQEISSRLVALIKQQPLRYGLMAAGVLVLVALVIGLWSGGRSHAGESPLAQVQRGPLTISVTVTGTIQNRERVIVKSQVEGTVTILSLIPEGKTVAQGDLLIELDSSRLQDNKTQQQISVLNAEAGFIRARENLAVTQSQTESDIAQAELAYKFAQLDLNKYLEGEYPQQLQKLQSEITIAEEELYRAEDKLNGSRRLKEEKYITQTEFEADELAKERSRLKLELAKREREVLENFTHPRNEEQLQSDVAQAEKALDRTKRKAKADMVQARADFKAKDSEFARQKDKLTKIDDQIAKCRLTAPVGGMVVYATTGQGSWRGNAEPLDEGQQVRERQELIHLPTTTAMMAEVKIHESSLRKVQKDMPVRITVDAVPGKVFWGRVSKIALLPDAQVVWLNPDLKVYSTEIHIETDGSALRPGMTCQSEILVEQYDDVLYVPLQSVVRVGGQPVVHVQTSGKPQQRPVQIGMDNNRMIRILEGLEEDEYVLLSPPLASSEAPMQVQRARQEPPPKSSSTQPADVDANTSSQPVVQQAFDPSKLREMTPEQRREWFQKLTPQQREEFQKRFSGGQRPPGRKDSGER